MSARKYDFLTPSEEAAVRLLADGETDKTGARKVGNDWLTFRDQVQSAKRKLGARTRPHLVALWIKAKI